jgi:nucleoside-diphosphate-sugar epimerase
LEPQLDGKRILVTGAGCVGSRLCHRLITDGAEVTSLDHDGQRLTQLPDAVRTVAGDITDPETVADAIDLAEIVIHTAAALDGPAQIQQRTNVSGTRTVVNAAAVANIERFVHLSSIAVYGFPRGPIVTEDLGPDPNGQIYSLTKAEGEAEVRRLAANADMSYAIIRPAGIFGPGAEYFTGSYMRRASRRPIVFLGRGDGALPVVFVDDVVELAMIAAVHPGAHGEAFNCAIDPPPTHRQYLEAHAALSGHDGWLSMPMPLARALAHLTVPFAKPGTYARQLPQNLAQIERYVRYSNDKAGELLDWKPRFDVASGVEASIPWLRERGLFS